MESTDVKIDTGNSQNFLEIVKIADLEAHDKPRGSTNFTILDQLFGILLGDTKMEIKVFAWQQNEAITTKLADILYMVAWIEIHL